MRKGIREGIIALLAVVICVVALPSSPSAQTEGGEQKARVIVRLAGRMDEVTAGALRERGIEPLREIREGTLLCLAPAYYSAVARPSIPGVSWIEPDGDFRAAASPPDDPDYPLQWNLREIRAEGAWEKAGGGSSGVVVAVVDSGLAWRESETGLPAPDLELTHVVEGYDFYDRDPYPDDLNGHGTFITEIIASSFNNGLRAAGIAYGCSIMPVRVLGPDASGPSSTVAEGIYWAADHGAKVICLALASTKHSEAVGEAVRYAYQRGALCVAAAGNEGSNPGYPGGMDCPADEGEYVLAVGATDARTQRAHYSNHGEGLDLVAPGGDLTRDDNADGFPDGVPQEGFRLAGEPLGGFELIWKEGTSAAAAQVAAAAALVASQGGEREPEMIAEAITSSCRDLGEEGYDAFYGHGLLDIKAAVEANPLYTAYFAEGTTLAGFEPWFCVSNDRPEAAVVRFEFFPESGGVVTREYTVAARSRFTLAAEAVLGSGVSFGTKVSSRQPVTAERPMYFDYKREWSGGSVVSGARRLSREWHFAEGYTARGSFDSWLCLLNPWGEEAELNVSYLYGSGGGSEEPLERRYYVGGQSRLTINVNEEAGYDREVSVSINSTLPVLAERPMYFLYKGAWDGGHCVVGATHPSTQWHFAEGTTREGFDTWICLSNPNEDRTAQVTVEYMMGQGQGANITRVYEVPALSRRTVNVNEAVGAGKDVSLRLDSTLPVLAERPVYFLYKGAWDGGHCVVGASSE